MILNLSIAALLAISIGLLLGNWLFTRRGSGSARRASASLSVLTSVFWISGGVFAILGGFYLTGMAVIALFFFIARGNYREATGGDGLRARIAG